MSPAFQPPPGRYDSRARQVGPGRAVDGGLRGAPGPGGLCAWTRRRCAVRRRMGLALLPQAGVALGMVLMAAQRHPQLQETLLPLVVASTVVFALVGPLLMRFALGRAGETE